MLNVILADLSGPGDAGLRSAAARLHSSSRSQEATVPDCAAALERNMREDQQRNEQTMKVWCREDGNVGISVSKSIVSFWSRYCGRRGKDLQSGGNQRFYSCVRVTQRSLLLALGRSLCQMLLGTKTQMHQCDTSLIIPSTAKQQHPAWRREREPAERRARQEMKWTGMFISPDLMGRLSVHESGLAVLPCTHAHTHTSCLHCPCV